MRKIRVSFTIVFAVFVGLLGCEQLQGPQGEQGPPGEQGPQGEQGPPGEEGPAYPEHVMSVFSDVLDEGTVEYRGIHFDTQNWWFLSSLSNPDYYDLGFIFDSTDPEEVEITIGQNEETTLYQYTNVDTLPGITELPLDIQRVESVTFDAGDSDMFFMIRNKYDRWAKLRVADFTWQENTNTDPDQHYFWMLFEYYYYKDLEPDLSLHKK